MSKMRYKDLPKNLTFDKVKGVYLYRNPQTGKRYSFGKDKEEAVQAALRLNKEIPKENLVSKVRTIPQTLHDYLKTRFISHILPEKDLSVKTLDNYRKQLVHIDKDLGPCFIEDITIREIAKFLEKFPPTQSNRYRALLRVIFKHIAAEGLIPSNPVSNTIPRKLRKKRLRLTLEGFTSIHDSAQSPQWFKNIMELGLLTTQRLSDLVHMRFDQYVDGYLILTPSKTAKTGLTLKIKAGDRLHALIERCKDSVPSEYIIHVRPQGCLLPNHVSKTFAKIRDTIPMFSSLPKESRPTFHEIRSLGMKLYEDSGLSSDITGHQTESMKEHYRQGHSNIKEVVSL